jgi:hypothetical protein
MKFILDHSAVSERLHGIFDDWRDSYLTGQTECGCYEIRSAMRRPLLSLLLDREVERVSKYFQGGIEAWTALVEQWDWAQTKVVSYSHHRMTINRRIEQGSRIRIIGKDEGAQGYLVVEEEQSVVPCSYTNENALLLCLLFRKYDLFQRLAGAYRVEGQPGDDGFDLNAFLIGLASGRKERMEQELAAHTGRYGLDAASKPKFLELLQGLAAQDRALLAAGLKKDTDKHDLMWSCKRYAKGPIKTFKHWKAPTYDTETDLYLAVAGDLVGFGWAQAYLSGAAVSFWQRYVGSDLELPETPWISLVRE